MLPRVVKLLWRIKETFLKVSISVKNWEVSFPLPQFSKVFFYWHNMTHPVVCRWTHLSSPTGTQARDFAWHTVRSNFPIADSSGPNSPSGRTETFAMEERAAQRSLSVRSSVIAYKRYCNAKTFNVRNSFRTANESYFPLLIHIRIS